MLRATILLVLSSITVGAQSSTPPPRLLEVISVKPVPPDSGPRGRRFVADPRGQLTMSGVPLGLLLSQAYPYPPERMIGAPRWVDSQLFDITGRGTWVARPTAEVFRKIVQQVLVERFNLRTHTEQRPAEVYALVLARRDGSLGPGLRRAGDECDKRAAAKLEFPPPRFPAPGQRPDCGVGRWTKNGLTLLRLGSVRISAILSATRAQTTLGRPVVDRTGLQGYFDIELDYVPDRTEASPPERDQSHGVAAPQGPQLTTALREQLGLRFEKRQEPVDVLVVDHVEMPSPN